MRIARLTVAGFRGVLLADLRLGSHSILVGPNNVGKTTVIEALALLFGRDKLVRELTEHDFTGSAPGPADRIRLVATLTDFQPDDPAAHTDWIRDGRGVEKWLDESTGVVHAQRD